MVCFMSSVILILIVNGILCYVMLCTGICILFESLVRVKFCGLLTVTSESSDTFCIETVSESSGTFGIVVVS